MPGEETQLPYLLGPHLQITTLFEISFDGLKVALANV